MTEDKFPKVQHFDQAEAEARYSLYSSEPARKRPPRLSDAVRRARSTVRRWWDPVTSQRRTDGSGDR